MQADRADEVTSSPNQIHTRLACRHGDNHAIRPGSQVIDPHSWVQVGEDESDAISPPCQCYVLPIGRVDVGRTLAERRDDTGTEDLWNLVDRRACALCD